MSKPRKKNRVRDRFGNTGVREPAKPCCTASVRLLSVTFRSDHLDAGGKKLLKRADKEHIHGETWAWDNATGWKSTPREFDSYFGDKFTEFLKPEWAILRGGPTDSHPISHTKDKTVTVDVELEVTVNGGAADVKTLRGTSVAGHLTFEKAVGKKVDTTQKIVVTGLVSKEKLPNHVTRLEAMIDWTVEVDGEVKKLGPSGTHIVYVTYDTPSGGMQSPSNNSFQEGGPDQVVTETRLRQAVIWANLKGEKDEKECVDRIFVKLSIGYFLGRRWVTGPNTTGMDPKPTLHHYLWSCDVDEAKGECHNIAAAFALACKILGVKGHFEVGYMNPWSSRSDVHPAYPKRGDQILGRYNNPCRRAHAGEHHGTERVLFLDGTDRANNFEGVAKYREALYAIGDARFDLYGDADKNASTYFAKRDQGPELSVINSDLSVGLFNLVFFQEGVDGCEKPYPWVTGARDHNGIHAATFKWHE